FGPLVAPQTATRPPDRTASSERFQVASPTVSTTRSAPPPAASFAVATTSSVSWLTVTSAPSSAARTSLSSLDEVTIVRAPSACAIRNAAVATPPPIPQTSTHSPGWRPARVTSIRYAVSYTSGNAAASSNETPSRSGYTYVAGIAASYAWTPCVCSPITWIAAPCSSPGLITTGRPGSSPVTPSPS